MNSYNVPSSRTWLMNAWAGPIWVSIFLGALLCAGGQSAWVQAGPKLLASDASKQKVGVFLGSSVAISADGLTVAAGGCYDAGGLGATWVFEFRQGTWVQGGSKLVGAGSAQSFNSVQQGSWVGISSNGTTLAVGGRDDDGGNGAVWLFERGANGQWVPAGPKLVGSGASRGAYQGFSGAVSADGSIVAVGGPGDMLGDRRLGATWVFERSSDNAWVQAAPKLVGLAADSDGPQGRTVAMSADGSVVASAGPYVSSNQTGAVWVFERSPDGTWREAGPKLVGSVDSGDTSLGHSLAMSSNGSIIAYGCSQADNGRGATWVFERNGEGIWVQAGPELVGSDAVGNARLGTAVAMSADGSIIAVGGPGDNDGRGAAWVFQRTPEGAWAQAGPKLLGSGAAGFGMQGAAIALSADGSTLAVGSPKDGDSQGAVWIFSNPAVARPPPRPSAESPPSPASINPSPGPHEARKTTSSKRTRIIAGSVAGGVAALCLLCLALAFVWCRRRRARAAEANVLLKIAGNSGVAEHRGSSDSPSDMWLSPPPKA